MAANVETMFYVREKPWHGLGTMVMEAPTSERALIAAGLNWKVRQEPIYVGDHELIRGYKANIRDFDEKVLGVVTDRYKVVQNDEAFAFTDSLLGQGVRYETAGSLQDGRKIWLLARMPQEYLIAGEQVSPYLVFQNSHDGMGAIKVAMTPIRVVCNNTLNLALNSAERIWSVKHVGELQQKMEEARDTLFRAEQYMSSLRKETELLQCKKLSERQVMDYIELLLPTEEGESEQKRRNMTRLRNDLQLRYFDAPDLQDAGHTAYRFINAVSDFATHITPLRRTATYQENMFAKTVNGNPILDRAYAMMKAV